MCDLFVVGRWYEEMEAQVLVKILFLVLVIIASVFLIVLLLDWRRRMRIFRLLSSPEPTDDEFGQALVQMPFRENTCYMPNFLIQWWTSRAITVTRRNDRHSTVIILTHQEDGWKANAQSNGRAELVVEMRDWCKGRISLG